jgi:hypothetical protein
MIKGMSIRKGKKGKIEVAKAIDFGMEEILNLPMDAAKKYVDGMMARGWVIDVMDSDEGLLNAMEL